MIIDFKILKNDDYNCFSSFINVDKVLGNSKKRPKFELPCILILGSEERYKFCSFEKYLIFQRCLSLVPRSPRRMCRNYAKDIVIFNVNIEFSINHTFFPQIDYKNSRIISKCKTNRDYEEESSCVVNRETSSYNKELMMFRKFTCSIENSNSELDIEFRIQQHNDRL